MRGLFLGVCLAGCGTAAAPAPEPPPVDAWHVASVGVEVPRLEWPTPCPEGLDVVVGTDGAWTRDETGALVPLDRADDDARLAAVLEAALRRNPFETRAMLSGAYNGPGGRPLFLWHLGFGQRVVVLDAALSRVRLAAVVEAIEAAGAYSYAIGAEARGRRACAWVATARLFDDRELGDPVEAAVHAGGTLSVAATSRAVASFDVEASSPRGWPSDGGVYSVSVHADEDATTADVVAALALARAGDRWPILALE